MTTSNGWELVEFTEGTEKQIKFANDIRKEVVESFLCDKSEIGGKRAKRWEDAINSKGFKFWLDNRYALMDEDTALKLLDI